MHNYEMYNCEKHTTQHLLIVILLKKTLFGLKKNFNKLN